MPSDKPTYSSAALRARDKRILDKHEQETNALVRRHDFRQGAATMSMFDMEHRCRRIADLLGYANISEAITEIETANIGATFRQHIHRLEVAEAGLEVEKTDNQTFRIRVKNMEKAQQKLEHEHRYVSRATSDFQADMCAGNWTVLTANWRPRRSEQIVCMWNSYSYFSEIWKCGMIISPTSDGAPMNATEPTIRNGKRFTSG